MTQHDPSLSDAAFRASVVGASEVAALFQCHPWLTEYEMYQRKVGAIATPEFNAVNDGVPENERAYWGVKIEPMIIEGACERWGYVPAETPKRLTNGSGLGGHPDKLAVCPVRGLGVLEAKMVDWLEVKKWGDEPPLNYLLQNVSYQGLAGVTWGDMIVLVGGNKLERFQYDFRPVIYADIEARVRAFWQRVEGRNSPKPDYKRDGDVIGKVYSTGGGGLIDLSRWNRGTIVAAEFLEAKERRKAAEEDEAAAKAELLERLGDADAAFLEGFHINTSMVKGSTYTVNRKPYRRFTVKEAA
jgi:predicted phage-related endonuclease